MWGGRRVTHRRLLHEAGPEPLSDATEVQVDAHQAELPSPLDELVGLHHQPLQDRRTGGQTEDLKQSTDSELIRYRRHYVTLREEASKRDWSLFAGINNDARSHSPTKSLVL